MEKKITIPAEVLEKLRSQFIQQVKDNGEGSKVTTVSWDYIHTDGNIIAIDAEIGYVPAFSTCTCATDRGEESWWELSRIYANVLKFTANLYNEDDELLTALDITNRNEVDKLFDVIQL